MCGEAGGREKPFYQQPMQLNCFMDKLSANFLIEIKDTFELAVQEQGRKHLQSRLFLILYSCNSDALWNLLLGWNCVYHVSAQFVLETGAQKVPLKPMALVFPKCNMSRGVMLWGPMSPITVSKRYSRPMFSISWSSPTPTHTVPTYTFHAGRSWHGMRSAMNVHVNSSWPVHEFTNLPDIEKGSNQNTWPSLSK